MNNNNILDISEIYKVFGEHKNNMVQTQGISMDDIVKQYARLFKNILKGYNELMFDNLLWHVMKFTEQTIEISEFSISPRRIYQIVDYVYHEKTWRYPAQPHRKRLQKVFIEPGYPSNLYKEYVKKTKMLRIRNAFLMCKNLGVELNTDNLITQYALLNNKIKKSEINDGQLTKIQKSEFKKLLDEMLANKNNPEWKGIIEVPVRKKQDTTIRKKQNTETRKNHKEWMDKLKELMSKEGNIDYQYFCDLYRGLIELPERKAFNKYKIKIKKNWK